MKLYKLMMMMLAMFLLLGATAIVATAQKKTPDKPKTEKQKDDDDGDDDDIYETPKMQKKLAKEAKISLEEARRIALERVPGTVIESEMDKEKGKVVYEFEIKTAANKVFEVAVDAKTGEIVEVEDETNDAEDDDYPGSAVAMLNPNS